MKYIDYLNEVNIPLSNCNSLTLLVHKGNQVFGHLHRKHKDYIYGKTFVTGYLKTLDLKQPLALENSLICDR